MNVIRLSVFVFAIMFAQSAVAEAARVGQDSSLRLYREGKAELERSSYNSSLKKLLKYVQAEERRASPDTARLMDAYYGVGGIYSVYSDFAQAFEVYSKGYALSVASGNAEMQFKFLNNMIGSSCDMGKPAEAERLNGRVRRLKGVGRGRKAYYYYFNKGFIAGSRGDDAGKAGWMAKAVDAVGKYRLPGEMKVYAWSELYRCYERQGDLGTALSYLLKYDSLARGMNQVYLYADCKKGLMRVYTKLGDKENALRCQGEYFRYTDSLLNINEFSQIKTSYLADERSRADTTINNLEKTNSQQKTVLLMLVLFVALAVAAVVVFYRQRQNLYMANLELFKRNGELLEIERKYRTGIEKSRQGEGTPGQDAPAGKAQAAAGHEDLLRRIMEVMEDEDTFCNPDFSLPVLARLADSNTYYVSQVINSTFGKNFRSFVNEYRIKLAMKRMLDTGRYGSYSIQGISESVGYKSASNFISAFKKFTGMTPSLYQKLSKSNVQ